MRSPQAGKFDTGDAPARSHGSTVTFMQTFRRVCVILTWFAGLVFVFAAANKNDPYLVAPRMTAKGRAACRQLGSQCCFGQLKI